MDKEEIALLKKFMKDDDAKVIKELLNMPVEQFYSLPDIFKARAMRGLTSGERRKIQDVYFNYIACMAKLDDVGAL